MSTTFVRSLLTTLLLALLAGPASAQEPMPVIDASNAGTLALLAEVPISNFGRPMLAWTPDGRLAVGMSRGLYDASVNLLLISPWEGMNTAIRSLPHVNERGFFDLAVSPTAPQLAVGSASSLMLYNLATETPGFRIEGVAVTLAYSPDGALVAFTDTRDQVHVWDVVTREQVATLDQIINPTGLTFSIDGATLAVANVNGDVFLWDLAGAVGHWMQAPNPEHGGGGGSTPDEAVVYSPDGRLLTSASFWEGGTVRMWDTVEERFIARLEPLAGARTDDQFSSAAFNPAGDLLAIGGGRYGTLTNGVYVWSVADIRAGGAITRTLARLPHNAVSSIAFSPDGALLASAGGGLVRLWGLVQPTEAELSARSDVNIVAYCQALGHAPRVNQGQAVSLVWSWYVMTPSQLVEHLSAVEYDITLDGVALEGWRHLSQSLQDPANDGHWTIYYHVPLRDLTPGVHEVEYHVTWNRAITDGLADFGPGTATPEESGRCTFEVS